PRLQPRHGGEDGTHGQVEEPTRLSPTEDSMSCYSGLAPLGLVHTPVFPGSAVEGPFIRGKRLVFRLKNSFTASHLLHDGVRCRSPDVDSRVLVGGVEEGVNGCDHLPNPGEGSTADGLVG